MRSRARVALVTGATGAIGRAIAAGLADHDHEVVITARDRSRGERALAAISGARLEIVDLSLLSSVRAFAQRWTGPLHVLVNNAADTPQSRETTAEGIERQWATNVLSPVFLALGLESALASSAPARVINVASYWAGGLELDDLEFSRRRYDNDSAYRQSKQANRMLTVALAERLADRRITVNACHPGDVSSRLSHSLGFGGHESPEQGADTPVWLATSAIGGEVTGKYFERRRETRCAFGEDRDAVEALYRRVIGYGAHV